MQDEFKAWLMVEPIALDQVFFRIGDKPDLVWKHTIGNPVSIWPRRQGALLKVHRIGTLLEEGSA